MEKLNFENEKKNMESELIPIKFDKVLPSKSYTCVVLGDDQKKFGIYIDPSSGKMLQRYLTENERPRPSTYDFISMIFRGYDIKIRQIVINDLQDTLYFARIFLEQKMGDILHILEIDARPSDCITLALISKTPIYCTREVYERVVPILEE